MLSIPADTVLETSRCILRAVAESDVPFVWSATRFPGFNDNMRWDPPADPEELVRITQRNLQSWASGREFVFTAIEKTSQERIGRLSIRSEDRESVWTFGYWVHPRHWGKGFAAEAARALIDFAFGRLGAKQVAVSHTTWNYQSKRVVEKLGMRFVRENPCGFSKNGRPMPEYEYLLDREEAL